MFYSFNPIEDNAAYNNWLCNQEVLDEVVVCWDGTKRYKHECVYDDSMPAWIHESEIEIHLQNYLESDMPESEYQEIKANLYKQVENKKWIA